MLRSFGANKSGVTTQSGKVTEALEYGDLKRIARGVHLINGLENKPKHAVEKLACPPLL